MNRMDRSVFIKQLEGARDLEDKFILGFDEFLQKHVTDNYHLHEDEKDFVNKRIQILLSDSKKHLNLFITMLDRVEQHQDILL